MERALSIAHGTEGTVSQSATIMYNIGVKGHGLVKHSSLEIGTDLFISNTFVDVGTHTSEMRTIRNDTTIVIQTKSRLYLVSQHMLEGSPLSMMDTRITAPITADCALIIHSTLGHYKVVQAGTITCTKRNNSKKTYKLIICDSMHLENTDNCMNACSAVGYHGYHRQDRNMPTMPSVHPPKVISYYHNTAEIPSPRRTADHTHQIAHDMLTHNIQENEDMMLNMGEISAGVAGAGRVYGFTGLALSLCCVVAVLLIVLRCTYRRRQSSAALAARPVRYCRGEGDVEGGVALAMTPL